MLLLVNIVTCINTATEFRICQVVELCILAENLQKMGGLLAYIFRKPILLSDSHLNRFCCISVTYRAVKNVEIKFG